MNKRERLLAILKGEKPDKIPWFADLSYIYFSMDHQGLLSDRYKGGEGYLKFHIDLDTGIFEYAPFLWRTEYSNGVVYG